MLQYVTGLFHLPYFQGSPMFQPISILYFFLCLKNVPLHDYTTFYLFYLFVSFWIFVMSFQLFVYLLISFRNFVVFNVQAYCLLGQVYSSYFILSESNWLINFIFTLFIASVCRNTTDFCMLTLCLATLLKLFINFNSFCKFFEVLLISCYL